MVQDNLQSGFGRIPDSRSVLRKPLDGAPTSHSWTMGIQCPTCPHPNRVSTKALLPRPPKHRTKAISWMLGTLDVHLDLQNCQNNGPYTDYTLCFEILGHYFGLFWRSRQIGNWNMALGPDADAYSGSWSQTGDTRGRRTSADCSRFPDRVPFLKARVPGLI